MRPRRRPPTPPGDPARLLADLRAGRLLPARRLRRLARRWTARPSGLPPDAEVRLRAQQMVDDGLLTPWQAEQVRDGRARQLHLGPYRLLDWLGAGGMGRVYKAQHRLLKRVVALKVVAASPGRGDEDDDWSPPGGPAAGRPCYPGGQTGRVRVAAPDAVAHFRREVRAAARLSHPNIVAAYDAARARGVFFLVLEIVEGVDLCRLVAEAGPLPVRLAGEAVRQAAVALAYAHERGVLHCDVKPSNLLLVQPPRVCWDSDALIDLADAGRPPPVVKLLDLGLARLVHAAPSPLPLSPTVGERGSGEGAAAELEGTPDYLAPERGHGDPPDARGDLYSLGCTLYHLLTGQPPYPGGDGANKLLRHRLDEPVPVRRLRPDAPAEAAAVLGRLMAREPEGRYPTAAAAAAALGDWLAGRGATDAGWAGGATTSPEVVLPPPSSPLPGPAAAGRRPPRFRPAAVAAAVVCGLALAAAARWAGPWRFAAPAPPTPSAAAPAAAAPFAVEGRPDGFATLAEAVAAAPDDGVVTVRGAGPHPTPPLAWSGKALTFRAAPGERPRLELAAPAGASPWQALLSSDRDLTLDGLELRRTSGGPAGRLVCVERAALRLTDCRLTCPDGVAVVHRHGGALMLHSCRVEAGAAALSVEVGDQPECEIHLEGTEIEVRDPSGVGLSVWAAEARRRTTAAVHLEGATITAGRAVSLTAPPGAVRVTAVGNTFTFRDAVLGYAGSAGSTPWRATTWDGRDNRYRGGGAWLAVDGRPGPVRGLDAWSALWGGEAGSSESAAR
jgi:serine/threonine-protein kinase